MNKRERNTYAHLGDLDDVRPYNKRNVDLMDLIAQNLKVRA